MFISASFQENPEVKLAWMAGLEPATNLVNSQALYQLSYTQICEYLLLICEKQPSWRYHKSQEKHSRDFIVSINVKEHALCRER